MAIRKLSEKLSMELSTNETAHDMPIPEAQVGLIPFIGYHNFTFILNEVKYMKIVNIRYNIFFYRYPRALLGRSFMEYVSLDSSYL